MSFVVIMGSLILGTAIFEVIRKKLRFIPLNSKKAAVVWGICFLVSMIVTGITASLIHGVTSLIILIIKISPIILAIYGVYYIRKKLLRNKRTNID